MATTKLHVGDVFPDFELPDHGKRPRRLSKFTEPSPMDEKLGFEDGYPLILIFGRGFFARATSSICGSWCGSRTSWRSTSVGSRR